MRIYESLRSTSRIPTEDTTKEPHTVAYGPRESLAYLAGAMPSAYAATFNVLHEISHRLSDFKPKTILDFGTGPGTALWFVLNWISTYMGIYLISWMQGITSSL